MYFVTPSPKKAGKFAVLGAVTAGKAASFGEFPEEEAIQIARKMNMLHPEPAAIEETPDDMLALLDAL